MVVLARRLCDELGRRGAFSMCVWLGWGAWRWGELGGAHPLFHPFAFSALPTPVERGGQVGSGKKENDLDTQIDSLAKFFGCCAPFRRSEVLLGAKCSYQLRLVAGGWYNY